MAKWTHNYGESMTKNELVVHLSQQFSGITRTLSREIVDLFLDVMKEELKSGDTVEMRDFGVLRVGTVRSGRRGIQGVENLSKEREIRTSFQLDKSEPQGKNAFQAR